MGTTVICEVEAVELDVECHACGISGHLSAECGDVVQRLTNFAVTHLDPHVRRAHFVGVGTAGRVDLGWQTWDDA